ncbi:hypothetical protein ncot_18755 [Nocardioides sp. JQ2195]|uniref:hypothetical protein n=1 Tax=Nocardioides sp. JQ2195 TaxID=2592334 RepID=UPI00143ED703|nr:hypothetical protein [Nocardioides sp. JQ2195]QIX28404.1 hypothetical protein ncot_18755 [Nocardioides sp. JQ2195]
MSKMDNLRAMREARYEAAQARAKGAGGATRTPTRAPVAPDAAAPKPAGKAKAKPAKKAAPATTASDPAAAGELCGHRNMGGRTCTRPHGHAEKSHRYS